MAVEEHKLIIEKGTDLRVRISVEEGLGTPKDLTNYTFSMYLMYTFDKAIDTGDIADGTIMYVNSAGVGSTDKIAIIDRQSIQGVTGNDPVHGKFYVRLNQDITSALPTRIKSGHPFSTEYNYYYVIDIYQGDDRDSGEDLRVLRGKLAVRV